MVFKKIFFLKKLFLWFLRTLVLNLIHHKHTTLCASFFFYLEQEYGRDAVFKLANSQQKVTEEIFLNIFKKNLSTLVAEWRPWAIDQFNKISGNEQILKTWQDSTPIKFFPRCKPPFIP